MRSSPLILVRAQNAGRFFLKEKKLSLVKGKKERINQGRNEFMKFLEDIPLITFKKREKKKKTRDNKINHMNKESVWSPLYLTENHIKVGRSYTLNLGARQHHRIIQPAAAPRDHSCALICG